MLSVQPVWPCVIQPPTPLSEHSRVASIVSHVGTLDSHVKNKFLAYGLGVKHVVEPAPLGPLDFCNVSLGFPAWPRSYLGRCQPVGFAGRAQHIRSVGACRAHVGRRELEWRSSHEFWHSRRPFGKGDLVYDGGVRRSWLESRPRSFGRRGVEDLDYRRGCAIA